MSVFMFVVGLLIGHHLAWLSHRSELKIVGRLQIAASRMDDRARFVSRADGWVSYFTAQFVHRGRAYDLRMTRPEDRALFAAADGNQQQGEA